MNFIWINFLSFVCFPFMDKKKYDSLNEYYVHKHVSEKTNKKTYNKIKNKKKNI